ncbi:hypothetical protein PIB30_095506 [Stylosanthes scabra]|uniref:Uncharacterized protein n=1 Tax=Stylosanthes scabra TaxID=79078 RepID=A0ABU6WYI4_9FABA|nr:hypothetical protein [Stylosanthes scabra]
MTIFPSRSRERRGNPRSILFVTSKRPSIRPSLTVIDQWLTGIDWSRLVDRLTKGVGWTIDQFNQVNRSEPGLNCPRNLKASPNLEAGSWTDVFDDRIVALLKNKTLLKTNYRKSPRLGIRSDLNPGPLFRAGPAS